MQLTYIFALFFALIVAVFAILNAQPVTVDLVFNEFQISLALIILVSAFAGAIILGFLGLFQKIKGGLKAREMHLKNKKLEEQLKDTEGKLTEAEGKLTEAEGRLEEIQGSLLERDNQIKELQDKLGEQEDKEKAQQTAGE